MDAAVTSAYNLFDRPLTKRPSSRSSRMPISFKVAACLLSSLLLATPFAPAEDRLIGTEAKDWQFTDWINSQPLALKDLRGKVILIRWWTGRGCPFCKATAPALKEFHGRYAN